QIWQRDVRELADTEGKNMMRMPTLLRCVLLGVGAVLLSLRPTTGAVNPQTGGQSEPPPNLVIEAGGHTAIIRDLIFTADGREVISASDDKTVRVWTVSPDGRQARLARTIRGQIDGGDAGALRAAALSPPEAGGRQRWLAVGGVLAGTRDEDRYAVR